MSHNLDMSLYNYVDVPNSNLICCICRTPFTDPVTTRACAHTFCKDCILRAIEHSAQCPVDRSPLGPGNLAAANPIVRSLVDELVVECVHRAEGCMFTCQRQLLPAHLLDSCTYREVPCPQGKCEETMLFKDSILHVHKEDLEVDSVKIQDAPVAPATDEQTPSHRPASPSSTSTDESHENNSSPHIEVASSSISSSAIHETLDPRVATLTEQNILLRYRVDTLESLLHSFKHELGAVKRALGPWFRVGEGLEAGFASSRDVGRISTELPVGAQPASASTSTSTAGVVSVEGALPPPLEYQPPYAYAYPFPYSNTAPPMPPADSLAPYFPAELEDGAHPLRRQVRTHRASSSMEFMGPHLQPYDPHNPFSPPPHAPLVAPLNLGTTLEGTLHGLRESVVGLAASVDSMGRRHEIALTNETTRMAEEVGGLRAGLHGLRMQIHAIMMDRNAQLTGRDGMGDNMNGQWMPLAGVQPATRPFYPQQPSITKL
ncbi:hypothetical protein D9615_004547 [Tricholomella constricta]|uniref:RING-type domain-containing protein n=1 Tax=Tricholomella constricta TaxID=117010 RepID=A0A8H5M4P1_9AGAR|nr:hypothetical protein D9615_004547 [Tricholomella constricta]